MIEYNLGFRIGGKIWNHMISDFWLVKISRMESLMSASAPLAVGIVALALRGECLGSCLEIWLVL